MIKYYEALENLPEEIKIALIKVFESFKEEISETVKKSDFDELKAIVQTLAEAQKKTEQRLGELAEAQKKTEQRLEELAEAQKRTEKEINRLSIGFKLLTKEVGTLSHTIGYRLEDESFKGLPPLLENDFGIKTVGKLKRDFIKMEQEKYLEVNIFGKAKKDKKDFIVVGEAKSQLKKKDIDSFIKKADLIKNYIPIDQIKILVTYQTSPLVAKYAQEKNIKIYYSYDF